MKESATWIIWNFDLLIQENFLILFLFANLVCYILLGLEQAKKEPNGLLPKISLNRSAQGSNNNLLVGVRHIYCIVSSIFCTSFRVFYFVLINLVLYCLVAFLLHHLYLHVVLLILSFYRS